MEQLIKRAEQKVKKVFDELDSMEMYHSQRILDVFKENNINMAHFVSTTGYGYDDLGRDTLDTVFAQLFGAEDALVRHTITCGTQAIALCFMAVLRPGDLFVSVTGKPYDTLEEAIGIRGNAPGNLKEYGVSYEQVELLNDGSPNYDNIEKVLKKNPKLVTIQRSKGYGWRKSIDMNEMKKLIDFVKSKSNAIIMVDNCYGEFVEKVEPTALGADLVAGSLIKNAGGGVAPTGGYIAGKKKYIEMVANRLTLPGIGKECGATVCINRDFYKGLFMAPSTVSSAVKTAILSAAVFEELGYDVCPKWNDKRTDIIQAIKFESSEKLIAFCEGIQGGSPIDSNVVPVPWNMPGYEHPVIMAAGAFIQGSSLELSADGPVKPPYIGYQQGGLTYAYGKSGILNALKHMNKKNLLNNI